MLAPNRYDVIVTQWRIMQPRTLTSPFGPWISECSSLEWRITRPYSSLYHFFTFEYFQIFSNIEIFSNIQPKKKKKTTLPSCTILGGFIKELKMPKSYLWSPKKAFFAFNKIFFYKNKPTECLILTHTCSTSSWKAVKVEATWATCQANSHPDNLKGGNYLSCLSSLTDRRRTGHRRSETESNR